VPHFCVKIQDYRSDHALETKKVPTPPVGYDRRTAAYSWAPFINIVTLSVKHLSLYTRTPQIIITLHRRRRHRAGGGMCPQISDSGGTGAQQNLWDSCKKNKK